MLQYFKRDPKKCIILTILFLLMSIASIYLLYAMSLLVGIENRVRFLLAIIIVLFGIGFSLGYIRSIKRTKGKYLFYIPITVLYSTLLLVVGYYIIKTYHIVDRMSTNQDYYYSSFVVLDNNKADKIEQFGNGDIGILGDSTSIEGNQLPKEVIESKKLKNKIQEYENYPTLIQALYDGEVEGAFLPSGYVTLFQGLEGYEFGNIADETKVIYKHSKEIKNTSTNQNASLKEPFTILLTGVDSEKEDISDSTFNGDSLMLITFNPITLNTTILSIPRDSFVPIACVSGNPRSKITHAASYGQQCMIDTIQNYTGITIDYYVKMNFKGVVKLVDTLGGVEVDVPFAFCEQNSNRQWGENTVYVEKGLQTLNGEQALAFARHREDYWSRQFCPSRYIGQGVVNDFVRGQHQQLVVRALLNKMKTVRSLDTVTQLLDTVSNNMKTNMNNSQILSLYNIGKDIIAKASGENVEDLLGIHKLYLSGVDAYMYDPLISSTVYEYLVYEDSLAEVVEAMKQNLGLSEVQIIKEFTFDVNEPYIEIIPGQSGNYSKLPHGNIPDFTGDTELQARSYANRYGISLSFQYTTTGNGTVGTVISQNVKAGTSIDRAGTVVLTILKEKEQPKEESTKPKEDEKETTKPSEDDNQESTKPKDDDNETTKPSDEKETEEENITEKVPGLELSEESE